MFFSNSNVLYEWHGRFVDRDILYVGPRTDLNYDDGVRIAKSGGNCRLHCGVSGQTRCVGTSDAHAADIDNKSAHGQGSRWSSCQEVCK